jgi:hypothetical protein
MNKLLLSVLCVLALFACMLPCFTDTVNGVLAEERVVNLPQDAGKWYISVVGDATNTRYNEVLGWFDSDASLKNLRSQVHYCPVTTNTAIYKERYQPNIKGLPTVRMQKADGTVVYEASGTNLPMTAGGLYGAMAEKAQTAQGIRPLLPWRRDMENRCRPGPQPKPQPTPVPDDVLPPNDGDAPIFDQPAEVEFPWLGLLVPAGFLIGLACGYGKKLYANLHPAVK